MDPTNQNEGLGSYVAGDSSDLSGPLGPTPDEKLMGMMAHVGAAVGVLVGLPFMAPLLILLLKSKDSAFIRFNAVESLNLQINSVIAYVVAVVLSVLTCGLGAVLIPVVTITVVVLNVMAGLKANEGQLYRYPIPMLRLIK